MATLENARNSFSERINNRNNDIESVLLPVLDIIRNHGRHFDGKKLTARFTNAINDDITVNFNLSKNYRTHVGFETRYDGTRDYGMLTVHYQQKGGAWKTSYICGRSRGMKYDFNDDGRLDGRCLENLCDELTKEVTAEFQTNELALQGFTEFFTKAQSKFNDLEAYINSQPAILRREIETRFNWRMK